MVGSKFNPDVVRSSPQEGTDIPSVGDEHVRRASGLPPVEKHPRMRVQAIALEEHPSQVGFPGDLKLPLENPTPSLHPLAGEGLVSPKRILDLAGGQEVLVDVTGDSCADFDGCRVGDRINSPAAPGTAQIELQCRRPSRRSGIRWCHADSVKRKVVIATLFLLHS